jgi:hypothetical protein
MPSRTADDINTKSTSASKQDALTPIDLTDYGPLVRIEVPNRSIQGVDATVTMDELSGFLAIRAGKNFQLVLREEPTTLEDIRQEIENEMMWQNSVTAFEDHSIIIERSLPDGSMAQHHFVSVLPGIGVNIVVRSDPMGEFSKKDVDRMLRSALTLETETGLAVSSH